MAPESLRIAPDWITKQPTWMKLSAVLVFGIIMVAAVYLSVQDYQTSRLGYLSLPSQKLDPEMTATLVGLLPQAFQIALAWIAATRKKGRSLALFFWMIAFLVDYASDLVFKLDGMTWTNEFGPDLAIGVVTWLETFVLYTFGSEFMLMFGWSNVSPLIAPTIGSALGGMGRSLGELWQSAAEAAQAAAQESGALFNMDDYEPQGSTTAKKANGGSSRKRS